MKKGDIVVCVDDDTCRGLLKGGEYEVLKVSYLARMIKIQSATGELYYKISRFKEKIMEFEFGELIEVCDDGRNWHIRRFLAYIPEMQYPYMMCLRGAKAKVATNTSLFNYKYAQAIPTSPMHTFANGKKFSEETLLEALKQQVED